LILALSSVSDDEFNHIFSSTEKSRRKINVNMYPRSRSAWLLALLVAVLILPARPAAAKTTHYYDFEKTQKPWASGAPAQIKVSSLTLRGDENGCPSVFDVSHASVQFQAVPGKSAGAWIVASFPGTGSDLVRLNWSLKGAKLCPNCKPILYLGSKPPSELSQFWGASPSGTDPPPWGDWTSYQYPAPGDPDFPVSNRGTIYVAMGMAAPSVKDVTSEALGLDCIELTIFPAP
jgi:hypothetical protein